MKKKSVDVSLSGQAISAMADLLQQYFMENVNLEECIE